MTRQPLPLTDDFKRILSSAQLPCEKEPFEKLLVAISCKPLVFSTAASAMLAVAAVLTGSPFQDALPHGAAGPVTTLLVAASALLASLAARTLIFFVTPVSASAKLNDQLEEVLELIPAAQPLYARAIDEGRLLCGLDVHFGQTLILQATKHAS